MIKAPSLFYFGGIKAAYDTWFIDQHRTLSSGKKNLKLFLRLRDQKYRGGGGNHLRWDELARYLSARWQPELVIMPYNHQKQHNFSSTLAALMHCYCFSILTGSACWVCWNQGPLLSSFNFSSSMPCRRKKIKEEERWKFWNKPFLLHDSDI